MVNFENSGFTEEQTSYLSGFVSGVLQSRELMPKDCPAVLMKLTDLGLTSQGAGADNIRKITATPTTGFDPDELLDVMP